jgi:hypothetical protein
VVLGLKPIIVLTKEPVPDPSVVLLSVKVGVPKVFQTTPLSVTADAPSLVISPPEIDIVL